MAKNLTRKNFIFMCIAAFVAFMLLINTNSYHADKNNLNTTYLIGGLVFAVVAIFFLIKVIKYGTTPNEKNK